MTMERTVRIETQQGLHARPGAMFVSVAGKYASEILLEAGGRTSNAKSIFGVLKLGVRQGDHLTIRATGPDESAAVDDLVACLSDMSKEG